MPTLSSHVERFLVYPSKQCIYAIYAALVPLSTAPLESVGYSIYTDNAGRSDMAGIQPSDNNKKPLQV